MPNPFGDEPKRRVSLKKSDWWYILPVLKIEREKLQDLAVNSRAKYVLNETPENQLDWAQHKARWSKLDRVIREIDRIANA